MVGRYRLNASAREVSALLKRARVIAVTRGLPVRLRVTEVDNVQGQDASTLDGASAGVIILEIRDVDAGPGMYVPANGESVPGDGGCMSPTGMVEHCVDLKTLYAGISLVAVDPVGLDGDSATGQPQILIGADGFVENSDDDFRMGRYTDTIDLTIANKRSSGTLEAWLLRINRAGGVEAEPWRGTTIPSSS